MASGWQSQVDTICKKVSAGLGGLKRIRSMVPLQTLLRMYEGLDAPYLDFFSQGWGPMRKGLSGRLQTSCKIRLGDYYNVERTIQDLRKLQDLRWHTLEQRC